ncbi:MAG: class I SAM-dependent methyltransferase [Saprospiraceae bacterium]|nr:class I SAM-dependent methyltransferase [Saprospiraceae bacterium]
MDQSDYLDTNQNVWNQRATAHFTSEFYDVEGFLNGKTMLNEIELELLGDIQNKSILHLQCHFGLDSLSLARMGANVTGVDFSDKAIQQAKELNELTGENVCFIQSDIFSLPDHLDQKFDIVFTSYGTIGWLPDLKKWAAVISFYLNPGGRFIFAEFHPFVHMLDDEYKKLEFSYFNTKALMFDEEFTYTGNKLKEKQSYYWWNHSLEEVINSLLISGLSLSLFKEYDYSPFNCFPNLKEVSPGKFLFTSFDNKIPILFSLVAEKPEK